MRASFGEVADRVVGPDSFTWWHCLRTITLGEEVGHISTGSPTCNMETSDESGHHKLDSACARV